MIFVIMRIDDVAHLRACYCPKEAVGGRDTLRALRIDKHQTTVGFDGQYVAVGVS
jgi:hypothetical protein